MNGNEIPSDNQKGNFVEDDEVGFVPEVEPEDESESDDEMNLRMAASVTRNILLNRSRNKKIERKLKGIICLLCIPYLKF